MKRFLSKKYSHLERTPMGAVSEDAQKYTDVIDLSLGDPDLITPEPIIQAAFDDAKKGHTKYTEFLGDPEFRSEIAKFYHDEYGVDYTKNEIMAVVGGCHGLYMILEAILDENDEVLIPSPFFTPYPLQVEVAGGKVIEVPTYEKDNFELTVQNLEKCVTPNSKAIIINYPNNPTGAIISKTRLEEIANFAKKHDLLILSDEIYTSFSFNEKFIPISSLKDMKDRTVIISSFSKDFLMTGWRIGYLAGNETLINTVRDINEGVCFTAPSISQRAGIYALKHRKELSPPIIDVYKKRIAYAHQRISETQNMSILPPRATFYLLINIKDTGMDSLTLSKKILDEAHVLTLPGSCFGTYGEGYIRIACTVDIPVLKEAFDRINNVDCFKRKNI